MALPHAASGALIDIRPYGATLRQAISTTLVRSDHFEVFRLVLPAGERVPDHKLPPVYQVPSLITIQCLEGVVEVEAHGRFQLMHAGTMLYLAGGESHALIAIEDCSLLVTMLVRRE